MNFIQYRDLIKSVKHGKMLPTAIYLHHSAIDEVLPEVLPEVLLQFIRRSMTDLKLTPNWNLLKLYKRDFKITLLHYPDFDDYAYPALAQSTTIDLAELTYRSANYSKSENPPILHRKETFVLENHPHIETFRAVTEEGENIGLYQNAKTIDFKQQWTRLQLPIQVWPFSDTLLWYISQFQISIKNMLNLFAIVKTIFKLSRQ
jgi:DNA phosphorothioation-associated putative methyltransferase